MQAEILLKQIRDAFPTSPIPSEAEILYEGAYRGESELEEIRLFFGNRAWNIVTPQDVFRFRHALSFFSSSAFAYFSAAWMSAAIQDTEAVDTGVEDLVHAITRVDPRIWKPDQRTAICEWLTHFSNLFPAWCKDDFERAIRKMRLEPSN